MVIQRDVQVPVTGHAEADAEVRVAFAGRTHTTTADHHGNWRVVLEPMPANKTGQSMVITSGDEVVTLNDVLIGEVWVCAGQSNMAWPVERTPRGADESASSPSLVSVRLYDPQPTVPGGKQAWPMETVRSLSADAYFNIDGWVLCNEDSVGRFSAVGYYFGKMLSQQLDVPIGLVDVAVGGTPTQSWVPRQRILDDPELRSLDTEFLDSALADAFINKRPAENLRNWIAAGCPGPKPEHYYRPGFMYEAGIKPCRDMPIAGIIWYQGESNVEGVRLHGRLFSMAIDAWREAFGREDLPVFWVQLPGIHRHSWPEFRDNQARLTALSYTGMAVAIDVGDPNDVHPRAKQPVGERLARLALHRVYDQPIDDTGPTLIAVKRVKDELELTFDDDGYGLDLRPTPDQNTGFWVAGEDRRFVRATARLSLDMRIRLHSDDVPEPVAVRYAWEPYPPVTLFDKHGLPAAPFRSDAWPVIQVACVGDSITFGMGTSNPNVYSYPAQLEHRLGPLFDVRNYGVSGSTVVNGFVLKGRDRGYARQLPYKQSLAHQPDIVIINLGINDVNEEPFVVDDFVEDYLSLIDAYRSLPSKPKVLIWGKLSPLFEGHIFNGDPKLLEIQSAIKRVVEVSGVQTIDMYEPLLGYSDHYTDQIHPDDVAAGVIADTTCRALDRLGLPVPPQSRALSAAGEHDGQTD